MVYEFEDRHWVHFGKLELFLELLWQNENIKGTDDKLFRKFLHYTFTALIFEDKEACMM